MAGTKSDVADADNLLDDDLKADKSVTVDMDLEKDTSWYITVEFSSGSDLTEKSLSFEYEDPASATSEISSSSVKISKEKKSASSGSGDITLAIVNDTTQRIYAAYLVEDERDFDEDDPDEDDLLDGDKLSKGNYVIVEDMADADEYDLILYYDDPDDDEDAYDYVSVDLSDADEYATIYVSDFSSKEWDVDVYTDDDDKVIIGVYNDSDATMSSTKIYEYDSSKTNNLGSKITDLSSISDGSYDYFELDTDDYDRIVVKWSDDSDDVDNVDDLVAFGLITIDSRGNATLEDMDDLT